jgi:hypothetical protein
VSEWNENYGFGRQEEPVEETPALERRRGRRPCGRGDPAVAETPAVVRPPPAEPAAAVESAIEPEPSRRRSRTRGAEEKTSLLKKEISFRRKPKQPKAAREPKEKKRSRRASRRPRAAG